MKEKLKKYTTKKYTNYSFYIKTILVVFFILTINISSGYLQNTTLSKDTQDGQDTQLATPNAVVWGGYISIKNTIRNSMFGVPVSTIRVSPIYTKEGKQMRILWTSVGMRQCKVYGPRGFYRDGLSGVARVVPIVINEANVREQTASVYTLRCDTKSGEKLVQEAVVQSRWHIILCIPGMHRMFCLSPPITK